MLLVHGLGGGTYELQWLGDALFERLGVTVEAIQLPGHQTPSLLMPFSHSAQWLQAVERAIESLPAPVHVIGFSTGASVVLRLAQTRSLSGRLIALAPFIAVYRPRFLPFAPEVMLDALPWMTQVPRRLPPLRDAMVRRQVRRCLPFATVNLASVRSAKTLADEVMGALDKVSVPSLVMQGLRDSVVDCAGARAIAAGLKCEHRLVEFPESDHLLALDVERQRVFDEAVSFLGAAARSGRGLA